MVTSIKKNVDDYISDLNKQSAEELQINIKKRVLSKFKTENYIIFPIFEKNEFFILIKRYNDIIIINNFNDKLLNNFSLNNENENTYNIEYKNILNYSVEFKDYKTDFFKSKLVVNIILKNRDKLSFDIDTYQRFNFNNLMTEKINNFILSGIKSYFFINEQF